MYEKRGEERSLETRARERGRCRSAFRGKEVNDVLKDFDELERTNERRGPGEPGNAAASSCSVIP